MIVLPALYFILYFVSDAGSLLTLIIQGVISSRCEEAGGSLHRGDSASFLKWHALATPVTGSAGTTSRASDTLQGAVNTCRHYKYACINVVGRR